MHVALFSLNVETVHTAQQLAVAQPRCAAAINPQFAHTGEDYSEQVKHIMSLVNRTVPVGTTELSASTSLSLPVMSNNCGANADKATDNLSPYRTAPELLQSEVMDTCDSSSSSSHVSPIHLSRENGNDGGSDAGKGGATTGLLFSDISDLFESKSKPIPVARSDKGLRVDSLNSKSNSAQGLRCKRKRESDECSPSPDHNGSTELDSSNAIDDDDDDGGKVGGKMEGDEERLIRIRKSGLARKTVRRGDDKGYHNHKVRDVSSPRPAQESSLRRAPTQEGNQKESLTVFSNMCAPELGEQTGTKYPAAATTAKKKQSVCEKEKLKKKKKKKTKLNGSADAIDEIFGDL